MLSSTDNINHTASSPSNSLCEGSVSPSSIHSHSQPSTRELNNSQHSVKNEITSDDPTDFSALRGQDLLATLSSNIEMHPQNESLSSTSRQQFIKRPLNAYMIWTRQERRKILDGDPKLKMNEVSKAIQMGEKWKNMDDKDKKPYFEIARKFAMEHKKALQDHPELTYAPSKKKGPKPIITTDKNGTNKNAQNSNDQSQNSYAGTPDSGTRSTTPRQISYQQFVPFQNNFAPGTMVLGVRAPNMPPSQYGTPPATPVSGSVLIPSQQQTNFAQPQLQQQHQQRLTTLGVPTSGTTRLPLDLYYTSLCQPAFPTITEAPSNPLTMCPPQYYLEQFNQYAQQQQQQQHQTNGNSGTGGPNSTSSNAAPHF